MQGEEHVIRGPIPTSMSHRATRRCLRQQPLVARLNKLPSGSGPGTTGRTLLDNPTTSTSTMAMLGELHPQASTYPALISSADYSTHFSGQPTSNPGTTTDKSGAAVASPFAIGAGLTGTMSTGGTAKKRGNGLFGVRISKEFPRTTPAGQPIITEVVADGRPEGG